MGISDSALLSKRSKFMAKQTENNVGIYMRLSKEDMLDGDSLSIENQKMLLTKFVREKGWNLISEYVDDGYSGTDFERPGIQRLLSDAQLGKINTVVVKDLSRFGRNYIEVGCYIDYIFPMNHIRFIAINDGVDTADRSSTALDMMPMRFVQTITSAGFCSFTRTLLASSRNSCGIILLSCACDLKTPLTSVYFNR